MCATTVLALACLFGAAAASAQNAYIGNAYDNTVSVIAPSSNTVIATATNTVIATIPVDNVGGDGPAGVAVSPDGSKVYVVNTSSQSVSVIDAATNTVTATIAGVPGYEPAVSPDGSKVYVTNLGGGTVWVIDTASNNGDRQHHGRRQPLWPAGESRREQALCGEFQRNRLGDFHGQPGCDYHYRPQLRFADCRTEARRMLQTTTGEFR